MAIPKIIHYCWFGGNPLPESAAACMESWKRFCPDYEIRRWDEGNFDYTRLRYTREAYEQKKWAFVTDVARLEILSRQGGIYLDTDVELLKPLDELLEHRAFMGFEGGRQVNTGLGFGAEPGHPMILGNLQMYEDMEFVREDGSLNCLPCPAITTMYLESQGLVREDRLQTVGELTVYPSEYFCPQLLEGGRAETTDNTVSIHHFAATWMSPRERRAQHRRVKIYSRGGRKALLVYDGLMLLKKEGPGAFLNRLKERLKG